MRHTRRGVIAVAASLLALPVRAEEALWDRLRAGGAVLIMRHARTTSGIGDPPGFRLDDCATQRNLDETGRAQARAWGDLLRRQQIPVARVLTSQWCRCVETARLLGFGEPEPFLPLNSFFGERDGANASRSGIHQFVAAWNGASVAVMVTHQVNITAAYDVVPTMGEALVVVPNDSGGEPVGRIAPPAT